MHGISLEIEMGEFHDVVTAFRASERPRSGRQRRDASDILHARIVWSTWCQAEGGESSLRARYRLRRNSQDDVLVIRSDEINSYRDGSRSLSRMRRDILSRRHSALSRVLAWPMHLLSLQPLTMRAVTACVRPYFAEGWLSPRYSFPGDDTEPDAANRQPVMYLDLERLYERGDAYGFLAILAAYRMFDLKKERDRQWRAARYLIKALPGFCRERCVLPCSEQVIALVQSLLVLLPDTSFKIEIDHAMLYQQINAQVHQPCRELRLIAAGSGVAIEAPEDPIVPYAYRRCCPNERPLLLAG